MNAILKGTLGFVMALTFFRAPAFAASTCVGDRDCANTLWGNVATAGQAPPHPPANHFNYPIPIGLGARPLGMGEAFTALADELSALWYNPAGIVQMEKNEIQWMGGDRLTDVPYTGFFAANYILQNKMNFALSYWRNWHPTGAIPDVIAGTYPGFTKWTGATPVLVPGTENVNRVKFTDITDTSVQDFLKKVYRTYINPAFQENVLAFTYATPLSADENLSLGLNVKYLFNDSNYIGDQNAGTLNDVAGWGVDLAFLYRQPLRRFGRELAVGLNLRDIAGQVRFTGGLGQGREVTLAPITTLGIAWKTNEYITRSKLNLALDWIYINDPAFDDDANRRVYLGGEMWFFKDRIAPRAGYSLFYNRQISRPTLGISFRYLMGLDYAYHFPGENEDATHWFSLSYKWGGIRKQIPTPDVNVTVDPPIFAPKKNEYATFTLKADSPNGIDRWSLNIIDRNNMVVKTYSDRGEPPGQILWGGEDKVYRILPDGEYTYLFSATDHEGGSSTTPVQTLKLYTPKEPSVEEDKIDELRKLIKEQEAKEEAVDDTVQAAASKALTDILTEKSANQKLPEIAKEPEAPAPLTPLAEARAAAGAFSYPRVNEVPFPQTSITRATDGKNVFTVVYQSAVDQPRLILRDIADVVRVAASDVGASVARYDVKAVYGSRELRVLAPAAAAVSLTRGMISREQFLETATVTLDGTAISPAFR